MSNPSLSEASSFEHCKHCGALLGARERFCPDCGEARSPEVGAGRVKSTRELAREALDDPDTLPPVDVDLTDLPPLRRPPPSPGMRVPGTAIATLRAASTAAPQPGPESTCQQDVPEPRGPLQRLLGGGGANLWVIYTVVALVLLGIALALNHFYLNEQSKAAKLREFKSNVAQVQSALTRRDFMDAQRLLEFLDADYATDPAVRQLHAELDRQEEEPETPRAQLPAAAGSTPRTTGPEVPAAPSSQAAQPAASPVPSAPPAAVAPATRAVVAAPNEKPCNETLAALALCSNEQEPALARDPTKAP